ncbi:CsbD-like superfamily [Synechococcus sp. PCC 7335]|uniref:CsbD family protein n=1 Tax=Synechococcus sp. (strain ATCC 29403 / PCC 7335) TaxID=91464 RepID=UPI00017ECA85|nr:CsbD family protein [Synechococcus sp. PCC 7335]EDX87053.1 CsbD-like superfamily [Synechococcus sp. PCC 7335]
MGLDDKIKNTAKDIEGKVQEAAGKATDNKEAQAKGKAKQAEASVQKAGENIKDGIKDAID